MATYGSTKNEEDSTKITETPVQVLEGTSAADAEALPVAVAVLFGDNDTSTETQEERVPSQENATLLTGNEGGENDPLLQCRSFVLDVLSPSYVNEPNRQRRQSLSLLRYFFIYGLLAILFILADASPIFVAIIVPAWAVGSLFVMASFLRYYMCQDLRIRTNTLKVLYVCTFATFIWSVFRLIVEIREMRRESDWTVVLILMLRALVVLSADTRRLNRALVRASY